MTASRSRKSATTGLAPCASSACTGAIFRPRIRTRWPRSSRAIASRFPRKPVPPVTSMFINYLTLKCQCYSSQCQARACADQQNAIAALYAAALHCFGQREWDGRGYTVAALGQVEKDLLLCETQAFRELLNGMPAGLVRHHSIYLVPLPSKLTEETLQERLDHLGCLAKHGGAAHVEHIHLRRSCRVIRMMKGAAAKNDGHISAAAIGFKLRVPDGACLLWRTTSDNSRGGSVTEQSDTLPLVRIERM